MAGGMGAGPRIGLMAIGLGNYWPQFPGMRHGVVAAHARLAKLFEGAGEVVAAGLVDTADASHQAGLLFAEKQVDVVFCHLTTYATSETLLPAVRALDVPIVLLNVQPVRALDMDKVKGIADWLGVACTCAALPEMTAVLVRLGKRFDTITGHLDGDEILNAEIRSWCALAGLRRRLRSGTMALLGRPFAGMMDLNLDETNVFRRFGTFIRHLDWDDVIAEIAQVSGDERAGALDDLKRTFDASTVSAEDMDEAAVVLAAYRRFVDRHRLCAIASHYEGHAGGERGKLLAATNPALSVLMADRVACPVEADMKVAFAMLTLKTIAGSATLAELYSMDFNDDVVIIGHSGAGDPAISGARRPRLAISDVFHGKSGRGYLTQFYPKAGRATMLSVTQDSSGDYRMVVAEGEIVDGPTLQLGDTNCRMRFAGGLRSFVHRWSSFGPTHHGVLGYGSHIDAVRRASVALGIPLDVVTA